MKKNKLLFIAALSATCLFSLASCQGAQGPKGDPGAAGINGTNGTNGKDGTNGASVLTGKGSPASSLGSDGDSYIDTDSFDFYSKADGKWSKIGNIKGNTGDQGSEGEQGKPGKDGTSLLTGNGVPSSESGKDGDSYIDLDTFDFYKKVEGAWSKYGNMKGADGTQGEAGEAGKTGTSVLTGKGSPASSLGSDGDSYIDTSSFDFYTKSEGKWSKIGNIKGEKGEAGEKGDKGNTGWSGSKGDQGDTAWSNTILPSTGDGYVTVDKGSAVVGDYVTFEFVPTAQGKVVTALTLNNADAGMVFGSTTTTSYLKAIDGNKLKVPMVAGGYVVKATFGDQAAANYGILGSDGKIYKNLQSIISAGLSSATLNEDISLSADLEIPQGTTFSLDLKGHNLKADGHTIKVYGGLEVSNTDSTKEAYIENSSGNQEVIVVGGSKSYSGSKSTQKPLFNGLQTYAANGLTSKDSLSIGDKVTVKSNSKAAAISLVSTSASVSVSANASVKNVANDKEAKAIEVKAGKVEVSGNVESSSGVAVDVVPTSKDTANSTSVTVKAGASIEGGTKAVAVSGGAVTVEGGEVKSKTGVAVEVKKTSGVETASVKVSENATVSTTSGTAIKVEDGKVEVAGTVKSDSGVAVEVVKVETADNTSASVSVAQNATVSSTSGSAVKVNGGSVEVKGTVSGNLEVVKGDTKLESTAKVSTITVSAEGASDATISVNENATVEAVSSTTTEGATIVTNTTLPSSTSKIEGLGTQASPYEISTAEILYKVTELCGEDKYFKQTANIEIKHSVGDFCGTYDGDGKTITYKLDSGNLGYIFGSNKVTPLGKSTVKNLTVEMGKVGISLFYSLEWGTHFGCDIENITFTSTETLSKVNSNNFGLVVINSIYPSRGTSDVKYTFKNITNNANILNTGTCTGFIIGSGPYMMTGTNATFEFDTCVNNGNISGSDKTGFLYGNPAYVKTSNNESNLDNCKAITVKDCVNNGTISTFGGELISAVAPKSDTLSTNYKDLNSKVTNGTTGSFITGNALSGQTLKVTQSENTFYIDGGVEECTYQLAFNVSGYYRRKDYKDWTADNIDGLTSSNYEEKGWYVLHGVKYFTPNLASKLEGSTDVSGTTFKAIDKITAASNKYNIDVDELTFEDGYALYTSNKTTYIVLELASYEYCDSTVSLYVYGITKDGAMGVQAIK